MVYYIKWFLGIHLLYLCVDWDVHSYVRPFARLSWLVLCWFSSPLSMDSTPLANCVSGMGPLLLLCILQPPVNPRYVKSLAFPLWLSGSQELLGEPSAVLLVHYLFHTGRQSLAPLLTCHATWTALRFKWTSFENSNKGCLFLLPVPSWLNCHSDGAGGRRGDGPRQMCHT